MSTLEEVQLLLRAARLYYEDALTQQEVAQEMGISRPTVSRLLAQARLEGIVQIKVADPLATYEGLESCLAEVFSLRQAVVVTGEGVAGDRLNRRLGLAAARYLRSTLADGDIVGVGLGRTLYAVVQALDATQQIAIRVLPLIGALGQISPSLQVNELVRRLAEAFNGTWQPLYAPAFIRDSSAYQLLAQVEDVDSVVQAWPNLDVALVGIGHFARHHQSSMLFAEYMDDTLMQNLEQRGAVGEICGRFFDAAGQHQIVEPGHIGISLDQLRKLNHVIAVAGGKEKVTAILGALRGGYPDVLVTDAITAQAVLKAQETDG